MRVNELSTGTTGSAADEFVELYNPGSSAIDVSGWKVVYRSAAGNVGHDARHDPGGDDDRCRAASTCSAATPTRARRRPTSRSAPGLAGTGGGVGVRDATGALVDSVGWGTATNALVEGSAAPAPPSTASPGSSIVRLPDGHDTDANASDFTMTATATPKAANH